jgi:hypothetical protein
VDMRRACQKLLARARQPLLELAKLGWMHR